MEKRLSKANTCKSIFKSTSVDERMSEFNRKWIELINRMERQHGASAQCQK